MNASPWPTSTDASTPSCRAACFELHTLNFVAGGHNALIIGKPGTGTSHVAKAIAYQATLQGLNVLDLEADSAFGQYALGDAAEQRQQMRMLLDADYAS